MYWASRISSISLQMVLPPLVGWWADRQWGTSPWLLIVAAVVGFASGMLAILKLERSFDRPPSRTGSGDKTGGESQESSPP